MEYLKLDNKMIKFIETINQSMKKIYNTYIITDDGLIFTHPDNMKPEIGFHFSFSANVKILRDLIAVTPSCVVFESAKIFEAIKAHKRSGIKDVVLVGKVIAFILKDDKTIIPIGNISPSDIHSDLQAFIKTKIARFADDGIKLPDNEVQSLIDGEIIIHQRDTYRLKMSKDIVPLLAKDSEIWSMFTETDSDGTFESILLTTHDIFTTYHIYKCIHINLESF